jgi:AcrR family transcriptional regulator
VAEVKSKFAPLPRGYGALPREVSRAAQRQKLVEACFELLAEGGGYESVSIDAIVKRAGVSKSTFYDHFSDKQAAFVATWEHATHDLTETIVGVAVEASEWREMLRHGMEAYLGWWSKQPAGFGAFLEAGAGGPAVLEQSAEVRARYTHLFAHLAHEARAEDPSLPDLSELALRTLVEGIHGIVVEWIRTGRSAELPGLADELEGLVLLVIAGRG